MVGSGRYIMVLEPILDPRCGGLLGGVCLFGSAISWVTTRTLCLDLGGGGGGGGGGGVFVTSHIRYGRNFLVLYKYGLLLT